ncbi:MAG: AraC family transcriptional regulator [Lachnospiraceae bacterium]|jgi:AraC-like DNA-binding protein/quercetin dioxygenase-like cupin family protein|nr:AraC family transcriptional regulator [Lachnospiraceae bacterium]
MIDQAGIKMEQGNQIAMERIQGVNDNMVKSHYHEYFELYFLESGQRYHMAGDTLYLLQPGEFILFPPYTMHYSYGDSDISFKRLILYYTKEMMAVPGAMDVLGNCVHVYKADEKREVHTILWWILKNQETDDTYSEESMYLLLNQLLITLIRCSHNTAKPEKETRINQIIRYLNENYTNAITLEELSSRFYLSPYYLCREFKKHTSSTIVQYLNSLRICHAQRLFQETDQSITEISKTVGFSNVTHLNRIYKSITGQSPSQTRKLSSKRRAELAEHRQFIN